VSVFNCNVIIYIVPNWTGIAKSALSATWRKHKQHYVVCVILMFVFFYNNDTNVLPYNSHTYNYISLCTLLSLLTMSASSIFCLQRCISHLCIYYWMIFKRHICCFKICFYFWVVFICVEHLQFVFLYLFCFVIDSVTWYVIYYGHPVIIYVLTKRYVFFIYIWFWPIIILILVKCEMNIIISMIQLNANCYSVPAAII